MSQFKRQSGELHISNNYKINKNQQYKTHNPDRQDSSKHKINKGLKKMKIGAMSIPINVNKLQDTECFAIVVSPVLYVAPFLSFQLGV